MAGAPVSRALTHHPIRGLIVTLITLAAGAGLTVVAPAIGIGLLLWSVLLAAGTFGWEGLRPHLVRRASVRESAASPPAVEVDQVADVVRLVVTHPVDVPTAGEYEAEVIDLSEVETLLELPLPWHVRWRGSSAVRLQILPGHEAVLEVVTLRQDAAQQLLWGHRREAAYLFHSPGEDHPIDAPLGAKDWNEIGSPVVAVRVSRVEPHYTSVIGVRLGFRRAPSLETIPQGGLVGGARSQIRHDQERDRQAQQSRARLHEVVHEKFGRLVPDPDELNILASVAQWVIDAPQIYGEYTYPILDANGHLILRFRENLQGVGIHADGSRETLEQIATLHRHVVAEASAWDWGRDGSRTQQRALMREIKRRQTDS